MIFNKLAVLTRKKKTSCVVKQHRSKNATKALINFQTSDFQPKVPVPVCSKAPHRVPDRLAVGRFEHRVRLHVRFGSGERQMQRHQIGPFRQSRLWHGIAVGHPPDVVVVGLVYAVHSCFGGFYFIESPKILFRLIFYFLAPKRCQNKAFRKETKMLYLLY